MLIFNLHHVEQNILHPDRKHITMSPEGLRRLIRTLRFCGFEPVSLADALKKSVPAQNSDKQVVLTFDDGYVNNLTEALPVLEQEQCPATVFVLPGRFDGTNEWDQGALPEERRDHLLSLEQMKTLAQSPYITLGSHGMRHSHFPQLDAETLHWEIHESYRILSETFGDAFLPVLAYPWGECAPHVVAAMEQSPYQYAFTVETAPWTPEAHRFMVPRYSAFYRDGNPLVMVAKLLRHKLLF